MVSRINVIGFEVWPCEMVVLLLRKIRRLCTAFP